MTTENLLQRTARVAMIEQTLKTLDDIEFIDLFSILSKLADGEGCSGDIDNGQRVDLGNKLLRELLKGLGQVFLLGVIELLATRASNEINHTVGLGLDPAIESLIERPLARDRTGLAIERPDRGIHGKL